MDVPAFLVRSFTVSYSLDLYRGGEKQSHFVSFSCDLVEPTSPAMAAVAKMEAGRHVTAAVIHDAVARGSLSQEAAKDLLHDSDLRHSGMIDSMRKKAGLDG